MRGRTRSDPVPPPRPWPGGDGGSETGPQTRLNRFARCGIPRRRARERRKWTTTRASPSAPPLLCACKAGIPAESLSPRVPHRRCGSALTSHSDSPRSGFRAREAGARSRPDHPGPHTTPQHPRGGSPAADDPEVPLRAREAEVAAADRPNVGGTACSRPRSGRIRQGRKLPRSRGPRPPTTRPSWPRTTPPHPRSSPCRRGPGGQRNRLSAPAMLTHPPRRGRRRAAAHPRARNAGGRGDDRGPAPCFLAPRYGRSTRCCGDGSSQ